MKTTAGILIRSRLCSPPGQAGSGRVAEAMAQAPPLTVPPFQAFSGSYRMRHLYASAG
jgi:hypothetical protein